MKTGRILFIPMAFLLANCASTGKSIALGSATGAVAGTVNGVALFPINTKKGMVKGALIGGVAGGLLGWFVHGWLEKRNAKIRRDTILGITQSDVLNAPWDKENPSLAITKPIVEGRWVEPKIKGKKLIEGHKEWRISEDSRWVFPQDIKENNGEENEK